MNQLRFHGKSKTKNNPIKEGVSSDERFLSLVQSCTIFKFGNVSRGTYPQSSLKSSKVDQPFSSISYRNRISFIAERQSEK